VIDATERARIVRSPPRLLVVAIVAACTVLGIVYFVKGMSDIGRVAGSNAALSYADRDIAGGNGIILDQQAAYEARAIIPRDGKYRVVTGSALVNPTSLTLLFVDAWFRYFLMPRRPAANAPWVICYGCDVSKLGGTYTVRWRDDSGISIGALR
jgi:hypothetical protein